MPPASHNSAVFKSTPSHQTGQKAHSFRIFNRKLRNCLAVEGVGAVVDGERVVLAFDGELATGGAVRHAAHGGTKVGPAVVLVVVDLCEVAAVSAGWCACVPAGACVLRCSRRWELGNTYIGVVEAEDAVHHLRTHNQTQTQSGAPQHASPRQQRWNGSRARRTRHAPRRPCPAARAARASRPGRSRPQ